MEINGFDGMAYMYENSGAWPESVFILFALHKRRRTSAAFLKKFEISGMLYL